MALKLRLARAGRKGRPFHKIVVADSRKPRDGRYIEKIGTYNPLLANDNPNRLNVQEERVKYWLGQGAKPSLRVAKILHKLGLAEAPVIHETPQKSAPKEKAKLREEERQEKLKAKQEAEAAAAQESKEAGEDEAKAEADKQEAPETDKADKEQAAEDQKDSEAQKEEEKTEDKGEEKKEAEA